MDVGATTVAAAAVTPRSALASSPAREVAPSPSSPMVNHHLEPVLLHQHRYQLLHLAPLLPADQAVDGGLQNIVDFLSQIGSKLAQISVGKIVSYMVKHQQMPHE